MTGTTKAEWLAPAGLLTLCAVPALAGVRVIQLKFQGQSKNHSHSIR